MLVYGDHEQVAAPRTVLAGIGERLERAETERGIARHATLVAALMEAGGLAQGLADLAYARRGAMDGPDALSDAALALARSLARRVAQSWDSGFESDLEPGDHHEAIAELEAAGLPGAITIKQPEGFAFYALYPEAYLAAARRLPDGGPTVVVGLRSIGTTLAAIAAAALPGAVAITVRPHGHPFEREIAVTDEIDAVLNGNSRHVIVDEGPGLSGSSVAAAIRLVEDRAGRSAAIHVLPGHAGEPGPQASETTRSAWSRADRHVVSFDELMLGATNPAHRLSSWCEDLTGPATRPPEEISGGWWRRRLFADESAWPPVHAGQERRKFLLRAEGGTFLLRFAGLGAAGERKAAMARRLSAAGFAPELIGLRHGFLVERWLDDAQPFDRERDRAQLIGRLAPYLAFRAEAFPAAPGRGASAQALFAMLMHNTRDLLDSDARTRLTAWEPKLEGLGRLSRPVAIDGRLHAWEWLKRGDMLIKTDAVDHHAAHDLVGCQDIAWDVAGATVEHDLTAEETTRLAARLHVPDDLLRFILPCYAAFQFGAYTMARDSAGDPSERKRLAGPLGRYADALRRAVLEPH